jgi:8-oxo-dGTP pyrophosphatase MutT (NUDIX family)
MNKEANPWKILNEKIVYDNAWIKVTHHQVINPKGGEGIYGIVGFKNIALGIVPIDQDGNTWLVGQYRLPTQNYSWEIPQGGCPLHLEPLQQAQRELQEETGILATDWQQLKISHLSNSVSTEKSIIYIATNLSFTNAQPEDTEQLQVKKISLQQAFNMVENGEITDAVSIIALQQIQLMQLQNKLALS